MVLHTVAALSFAVLAALGPQDPLRVQPDPQNPVAAAIVGSWRRDPDLGRRLGAAKAPPAVEFHADAAVTDRLPAGAAALLAGRRVYAAGTARVKDRDALWVLTEQAGSASVLMFRDGSSDVETLTVMLVRGAAPAADLLFVSGDPSKPPFAAYARVEAVASLEPAAALTEMARLLETGDHAGFLGTWCLPDDLEKMLKGRTLQACAADFAEGKAKEVLSTLHAAAKLTPAMSAGGDEAVYTGDGLPRPLRLKRIGTRWYLCNR